MVKDYLTSHQHLITCVACGSSAWERVGLLTPWMRQSITTSTAATPRAQAVESQETLARHALHAPFSSTAMLWQSPAPTATVVPGTDKVHPFGGNPKKLRQPKLFLISELAQTFLIKCRLGCRSQIWVSICRQRPEVCLCFPPMCQPAARKLGQ